LDDEKGSSEFLGSIKLQKKSPTAQSIHSQHYFEQKGRFLSFLAFGYEILVFNILE